MKQSYTQLSELESTRAIIRIALMLIFIISIVAAWIVGPGGFDGQVTFTKSYFATLFPKFVALVVYLIVAFLIVSIAWHIKVVVHPSSVYNVEDEYTMKFAKESKDSDSFLIKPLFLIPHSVVDKLIYT